ncbi:putative serine/threonine-protein phosphatase 2A regulatory subunit B'' subunit TON2 [Tanacetum coccineum]
MIMRSLLYPEAINNSFIMMFTKPEDGSISRKVQRLAKYRFLKKQSDLLLNADDLDAMWVCLRENYVIMMTPLVQGRQLVASGILLELFENNIHQGPKTARVQARAALCAFSEGDKNAATEFECSYTEEELVLSACSQSIRSESDLLTMFPSVNRLLEFAGQLHASQDPFPLAAVCGNVWRNTKGQLSFLKYVISAAPEVFTFAHCKRQLVSAVKLRLILFEE